MKSRDDIRMWLTKRIGEEIRRPPEKLDPNKPFTEYGIDSAAAVGVVADLEDFLGRPLDPTLFYTNPTVQELADHLADEEQQTAAQAT